MSAQKTTFTGTIYWEQLGGPRLSYFRGRDDFGGEFDGAPVGDLLLKFTDRLPGLHNQKKVKITIESLD